MTLTPEQRSLRARIAANTRWAKEDPAPNMVRARMGFDARFEREVDPCGSLPEDERRRRAECARRAHFQRMALASSRVRQAKAGRARSR